jgi:hypothetical protein
MITFVLSQILSLQIIKMANAMQKTMLAVSKISLTWVFFMLYQEYGHEDWSTFKAIGMCLLVSGTVWYVKLDIKDIESSKLEKPLPP